MRPLSIQGRPLFRDGSTDDRGALVSEKVPPNRDAWQAPLDRQQTEMVLSLADGALPHLRGSEREDAERLLALCRAAWVEGKADPGDWRRRIGGLVEPLARRSAQAMPYAALGRALLADLHGDPKMARGLLHEFEVKLAQLGLS